MTAAEILDLADRIGVSPGEVQQAISLMKTGRTDLITAVVKKRMTVGAALQATKLGLHQPRAAVTAHTIVEK